MATFKDKIVIVTGASAGIGAATAKALAEAGAKVVGVARRKNLIEDLAKTITKGSGKIYAFQGDLTKEDDIINAFKWTTENVGPLDYLINNAGLALFNSPFAESPSKDFKTVLDTNVLAVAVASREAVKIMTENNIAGHIVNVSSVLGKRVPNVPGFHIYIASKHALTAFSESLRLELIRNGSKIKVTNVSPGGVTTEFASVANIPPQFSENMKYKMLEADDVANSIVYVLNTPPHVQITELTLQGTSEPF